MNTKIEAIQDVRRRTGCGILDAKEALEQVEWTVDAAVDIIEMIPPNRSRDGNCRFIFQYNHNRRISSTIVLSCNTDFVGKMPEFIELGEKLAQQLVGMNASSVEEFLQQDWLREKDLKVKDMVNDLARKTQENINIVRFSRENV